MKKVFISADIEGTCGIAAWQETNTNNEYSSYFLNQMSNEVAAACRGALKAGAKEVFVKDAHDTARNIFPNLLPKEAMIMRGWANSPLCMMAGLDDTFDAAIYTGYHSAAGTNGNPLSHTMHTNLVGIKINGETASEFIINAYAAAYLNVPSVLLTGDKMLCESAERFVDGIKTVAVSEGTGNASASIHPTLACEMIEKASFEVLSGNIAKLMPKMPDMFETVVTYKEHSHARSASYYPGAFALSPTETGFKSKDYMDVLKFYMFVL